MKMPLSCALRRTSQQVEWAQGLALGLVEATNTLFLLL